MQMTTDAIRQAFLNYFNQNGHQIVDSSSLVPHNDPTLLFTNAGMNQFKDLFLGAEKRDYVRAVTAQRCVRAGGKHNDLDNVGFTARHHTFFEMLGNFSFGDYFKNEAIHFAWQFLTEVLQLPKDKLSVTVYHTDDEAYRIWSEQIGVPKERIIRIGDKGDAYNSDNFWQMGDTGPCGPCSEIFFDHGASIWGGPPGSAEEDGDRFIEIWNLVFMQFNRQADGSLLPLPKPSVDTGMGLERLAAVLQHVHSNYEIDLFENLIKEIAIKLHVADLNHKSLRVIADHIRSCGYLIADGILPSNEGRGYVLRRIIRRAIRHGHKLGATEPFFYQLVPKLVQVMGSANLIIARQQTVIEQTIFQEEQNFARTLDRGMALLNETIINAKGTILDGDTVFKLYDTYGFPIDLTSDVARDHHLTIDEAGFEVAMQAQRDRARSAGQFSVDYNQMLIAETDSNFCGYDTLTNQGIVTEIYHNGHQVTQLNKNEEGIIFLDNSPFYAESGGQSGDIGRLYNSQHVAFNVVDTQKYGKGIGHIGQLTQGVICCGDILNCEVNQDHRQNLKQHHSATHLLHAALRQVLGDHVQQKGSLVKSDSLRFDFSHGQAITKEQLAEIEKIINDNIRLNHKVVTEIMAIDAAKDKGAMALFDEKYDSKVRVLTMGPFSIELCGGTHVDATGEIGLLKIVSENGIAAGIRRIEAVAGAQALAFYTQQQQQAQNELEAVQQRLKQTEKQLQQLKDQMAAKQSLNLIDQVQHIKGVNVLIYQLANIDNKMLRTMVDELKNKLKSGVILLANVADDKVQLIAGVTDDLTSKIKAGELVNCVAQQIGGKGGGRADMAQAGGQDIAALPHALTLIQTWISEQL